MNTSKSQVNTLQNASYKEDHDRELQKREGCASP